MTPRRGAALATMLAALTIIAALGAGALYAARVASRTARDATAILRASLAADGALHTVRHPWDARRNQLAVGAVGAVDVVETRTLADAVVTTRLVRLDATRFLVEAAARASARASAATPGAGRAAERTAAAWLRLIPAAPVPRGAITATSAVSVTAGAVVDGADHLPDDWSACAPTSTALDDVALDTTAATYDVFGAERYADVAARAAVQLEASGSPRALPAADSATFPLAHARGALTLRGPTRGRGTLLVDGDLTIDGLVAFAGVVVVRGALLAAGGALRLDGALFVAGGPSALGTGSRVRWSSCAYERARDGAARVEWFGRHSRARVTR